MRHRHQLSSARTPVSKHEKKPAYSLMNVLRPKVYITDISSFKRLVQELTGNNGATSLDHQDIQNDSSWDGSKQGEPFTADMYNDMVIIEGRVSETQTMDDLMLRDLESWLLEDVEMAPYCSTSYAGQLEGGVSLFDCELAGGL